MKKDYWTRDIVIGRDYKLLGWREASAVSPIVYAHFRYKITQLVNITGVKASTLERYYAPLVDAKFLHQIGNSYTIMIGSLADNKLRQFLYMAKGGKHPTYFSMGVRGECCPLSVAENYLYWWLRSQNEQGKKAMSKKEIARLSNMAETTVKSSWDELLKDKWITVVGGEWEFPEQDYELYFPHRTKKSKIRNITELPPSVKGQGEPKPRKPRPLKIQFEEMNDDTYDVDVDNCEIDDEFLEDLRRM